MLSSTFGPPPASVTRNDGLTGLNWRLVPAHEATAFLWLCNDCLRVACWPHAIGLHHCHALCAHVKRWMCSGPSALCHGCRQSSLGCLGLWSPFESNWRCAQEQHTWTAWPGPGASKLGRPSISTACMQRPAFRRPQTLLRLRESRSCRSGHPCNGCFGAGRACTLLQTAVHTYWEPITAWKSALWSVRSSLAIAVLCQYRPHKLVPLMGRAVAQTSALLLYLTTP